MEQHGIASGEGIRKSLFPKTLEQVPEGSGQDTTKLTTAEETFGQHSQTNDLILGGFSLKPGAGLDALYGPLPTYNILWFYGHTFFFMIKVRRIIQLSISILFT